jgi:hypothetical protein
MESKSKLCTKVFAGCYPFADDKNDVAVLLKVVSGQRPPRPNSEELSDEIWNLMQDCWTSNPPTRPTAAAIVDRLATIVPLTSVELLKAPQTAEHLTLTLDVEQDSLDPVVIDLQEQPALPARIPLGEGQDAPIDSVDPTVINVQGPPASSARTPIEEADPTSASITAFFSPFRALGPAVEALCVILELSKKLDQNRSVNASRGKIELTLRFHRKAAMQLSSRCHALLQSLKNGITTNHHDMTDATNSVYA